jgi:hypothetical protein
VARLVATCGGAGAARCAGFWRGSAQWCGSAPVDAGLVWLRGEEGGGGRVLLFPRLRIETWGTRYAWLSGEGGLLIAGFWLLTLSA